jgi:hypothetical protein
MPGATRLIRKRPADGPVRLRITAVRTAGHRHAAEVRLSTRIEAPVLRFTWHRGRGHPCAPIAVVTSAAALSWAFGRDGLRRVSRTAKPRTTNSA